MKIWSEFRHNFCQKKHACVGPWGYTRKWGYIFSSSSGDGAIQGSGVIQESGAIQGNIRYVKF